MSGGAGGGTGGGDGGPGGGSTIRWVPVICSRVIAVLTSCTLCAGSAGAVVAAIVARAGAAAITMRVGARAAGVATSAAEPVIGWGGGAGGVAGGLWGAAATVWMFRANSSAQATMVAVPRQRLPGLDACACLC
jgi:hypothetical protein